MSTISRIWNAPLSSLWRRGHPRIDSPRYLSVTSSPARSIIQATADQTADFLSGAPLVSRDSIDSLVTEVGWLAAAIRIVATAVSVHPFDLMRGDDAYATESDLAKHPQWLRGYNEGFTRLVYRLAYAWLVHGEAYTFIMAGSRSGAPKGLQFLLPGSVKPRIDKKDGLVGWWRWINGQKTPFGLEQIIPYWEPSISKEIGPGPAPALAAGSAALLLQSLDTAVNTAFRNGPIMITLVGFPEGTNPETIQRVMADLRDTAAGKGNAGVMFPLILKGSSANAQPELITKELSIKPKEMAAPEIEEQKIKGIAAVIGVPLSILKSDSSHFSTMAADGINIYEFRAGPMFRHICEQINEWIGEQSGEVLEPQPHRLMCYQAQRLDLATGLVSVVNAGIMTKNEARIELGLPEIDEEETPEVPDETTLTDPTTPEMPPETPGPDDGAGQQAQGSRSALAVPLSQDALESVRLWARKSKRRGELAEWESALVPQDVRERIARTYAERGHWAAFAWSRSVESAMKELTSGLEAELLAEFNTMKAETIKTIMSGGTIDWLAIETLYSQTLGAKVADIVTDTFGRVAGQIGPQFDTGLVHTKAMEWASAHAYERGKMFVETTRPIVQEAMKAYFDAGGKVGQKELKALLAEKLGPAFSEARVSQIAITEVTTALNQANLEYQEMLSSELGIPFALTWQYEWAGDRNRTDFPCPVCEPMNGVQERKEGGFKLPNGEIVDGPPAHVNCYCTTSLGPRDAQKDAEQEKAERQREKAANG